MSEEKEEPKEQHGYEAFQKQLNKLQDPSGPILGAGCALLVLWAGVFCWASLHFNWHGTPLSLFMTAVYFVCASFTSVVISMICAGGGKSWVRIQFGYLLTILGLCLFIAMRYEPNWLHNILFHTALGLTSIWGSYVSVGKQKQDFEHLKLPGELLEVVDAYKPIDFHPTVLQTLDRAVKDREDIHFQSHGSRLNDTLFQQAEILDKADEALGLLIEQGVPLSRLLERKDELISNGKIDSNIGDQLYDQLQPAEKLFKDKATALHELAISVLGFGSTSDDNIAELRETQKDIELIRKTREDLD